MKRNAKKVVRYTNSFKNFIVHAVVRDGQSIASVCAHHGIDEMYKVREWVREFMKKRGLTRIPRSIVNRGKAPKVFISEPVNRQLRIYEEMIEYQEFVIETLFEVADEDTKKKLLDWLSPKRRANLRKKEKLST
ncbi:MAG: transposase [Chloroflexi bacterium]|nr:transposase [Chloroflexota bacterium]